MTRLHLISDCGGVGRTTIAANLAHALAARGERVQLRDADPQQSLAVHFQALAPTPPSRSPRGTGDSTRALTPNIDLLGSGAHLSAADRLPASRTVRTGAAIEIIDTPVGVDPAAPEFDADDHVMVVLACDARCYRTVPGLLERMMSLTSAGAGSRLIALINGFEPESVLSRDTRKLLERAFGERLLEPVVLRDLAVPEAFAAGLPVTEYAPWSQAADTIGQVADRVISLGKASRVAA